MFEHAVSRNSIALPETFKQPVPAWGCALSVSPSHIKCVCVRFFCFCEWTAERTVSLLVPFKTSQQMVPSQKDPPVISFRIIAGDFPMRLSECRMARFEDKELSLLGSCFAAIMLEAPWECVLHVRKRELGKVLTWTSVFLPVFPFEKLLFLLVFPFERKVEVATGLKKPQLAAALRSLCSSIQ